MLRKLMLLAAGFAVLALSACNGSAPTLPPLTFAQQVGLACNYADTAVTIMTDDGLFTGGALNTLNTDVKPAIGKVCAAGATVTTPNLQALSKTALPLLKSVVDASSLAPQAKNDAKTAIDLTAAAINTAILLQPAASAPTPASTPLAGAALQ
ncbi:hypothetical protein P5W99_24295 [Paraburkholderia sp. A3BS-1L]|uniref:hypothetical protein n=1 Tax=Paraburkholderia sp. A3BS-1L TaxID=3028375 RepID=UPI003DA7F7A6